MLRAGASVKESIVAANPRQPMANEKPAVSHHAPTSRRPKIYWRFVVLGCIVGLLIYCNDYRPDTIELATAPYRFSSLLWELGHLPDKWTQRWVKSPRVFFADSSRERRLTEVEEFFADGLRLRSIDRILVEVEAQKPLTAQAAAELVWLREEQSRLRERQARLRLGVEETLEAAIADTLQSLGFQAWTGVFPPVDTVLIGSPTVLVTSPRDRIVRQDNVILDTGLTGDQRAQVESRVEAQTELSALVVNTGGIAFYPSITLPDAGLDFALEVVAHEWVHQWLWFRPLGRRYFEGGDITAINETVSDIAGREIGEMARRRLESTPPPDTTQPDVPQTESEQRPAAEPPRFDFQKEMHETRTRVDALLSAGDVSAAEAYMEERRRAFVANGYPIRRLNQAYFAFHGTYATTGAAGVNIIGQQVEELRRRSSSLGEFLRAAAEIKDPAQLSNLVSGPVR